MAICQKTSMHLGYFWCLAELHNLLEECSQNCEGVGVTMDGDVDSTATPRREQKTNGVETIINFMQSQMKTTDRSSMWQFEMSQLNDKISQLKTEFLFLKVEKYDAQKSITRM